MKDILRRISALLVAALLVLGTAGCGADPAQTGSASAAAPSAVTAPETPAASDTAPADPTASAPTAGTAPAQPDTTAIAPTETETDPPASEAPAAPSEDLPGYYKLYATPSGDFTPEELEDIGIIRFFAINDDGSGYFYNSGVETGIVCSADTIAAADSSWKYTLEGDLLTVYLQDGPWSFIRSSEPAPKPGTFRYARLGLTRTEEIVLTDEVLSENDIFRINAGGIFLPESDEEDYLLSVQILNKTDKGLDFSITHILANGVTLSSDGEDIYVRPGETRDIYISLLMQSIQLAGIGDPTVISLRLKVSAPNGKEPLFNGYVNAYPLGKDKAELLTVLPGDRETPVFENDYVRIRFLGFREEEETQQFALLYWIENKTDAEVSVLIDRSVYNSESITVSYSSSPAPHAAQLLPIYPSALKDLDALKISDLSEIRTISLDLQVFDSQRKNVLTQTVSFQP